MATPEEVLSASVATAGAHTDFHPRRRHPIQLTNYTERRPHTCIQLYGTDTANIMVRAAQASYTLVLRLWPSLSLSPNAICVKS